MAPTPEEEVVVSRVGKHVRDTLRPVFADCKIYTSGSTSTGLRLPQRYCFFFSSLILNISHVFVLGMWNSDIDLVVETIEEISSTDGLVQLADLVRGKAWAEYVDEILDARVPIIKISTTHEFGMGIFYILLKVDEFVFCPRIIES